jgi:CxxC motif-containing protein (DUF1111 family)
MSYSQTSGKVPRLFNGTPEDHIGFDQALTLEISGDVMRFTHFMRFLAPPASATSTASTMAGAAIFRTIGCALCHTPSLTTGNSSCDALSNKTVNLYSDLLVHNMGPGLADDIVQGLAGPSEFRTAPLWGLGQRIRKPTRSLKYSISLQRRTSRIC